MIRNHIRRRIICRICSAVVGVILAACTAPSSSPPTPTSLFTRTPPTASPAVTALPTVRTTETPASPPLSSASGIEVFTPSADAFIDSAQPEQNFGDVEELLIGPEDASGSPPQGEQRLLLRFQVDGIPERAEVVSARLRLWLHSSIDNDSLLYNVEGEWEEHTVHWNNAPALGTEIAAFTGEIFREHWDEVEIEHIVQGNGRYDFYLVMQGEEEAIFNSREHSYAPQLIVEWSDNAVAQAMPDPAAYTTDPPVLVGAGDVASCDMTYDEATAALIEQIPGAVFVTGDTVYDHGTPEEYQNCYEPSWGRFRDRTFPTPGDHEYNTPGAAGYFQYYGPVAGDRDKGYYSYNLGEWHVIVLNTNCRDAGGCREESEQAEWLRQDLLANASLCALAYWHEPQFSLAGENNDHQTKYFWEVLYEHGVELVLNGDEHYYARFAPQNPNGQVDPLGIRQFIVGTGGRTLYEFETQSPNVEARDNTSYGVLKLTLHPDRYDWEFISVNVPGMTYTDSGSATCH